MNNTEKEIRKILDESIVEIVDRLDEYERRRRRRMVVGEIADMMLEGELCCVCGAVLEDDAPDCPTMCEDCAYEE